MNDKKHNIWRYIAVFLYYPQIIAQSPVNIMVIIKVFEYHCNGQYKTLKRELYEKHVISYWTLGHGGGGGTPRIWSSVPKVWISVPRVCSEFAGVLF